MSGSEWAVCDGLSRVTRVTAVKDGEGNFDPCESGPPTAEGGDYFSYADPENRYAYRLVCLNDLPVVSIRRQFGTPGPLYPVEQIQTRIDDLLKVEWALGDLCRHAKSPIIPDNMDAFASLANHWDLLSEEEKSLVTAAVSARFDRSDTGSMSDLDALASSYAGLIPDQRILDRLAVRLWRSKDDRVVADLKRAYTGQANPVSTAVLRLLVTDSPISIAIKLDLAKMVLTHDRNMGIELFGHCADGLLQQEPWIEPAITPKSVSPDNAVYEKWLAVVANKEIWDALVTDSEMRERMWGILGKLAQSDDRREDPVSEFYLRGEREAFWGTVVRLWREDPMHAATVVLKDPNWHAYLGPLASTLAKERGDTGVVAADGLQAAIKSVLSTDGPACAWFSPEQVAGALWFWLVVDPTGAKLVIHFLDTDTDRARVEDALIGGDSYFNKKLGIAPVDVRMIRNSVWERLESVFLDRYQKSPDMSEPNKKEVLNTLAKRPTERTAALFNKLVLEDVSASIDNHHNRLLTVGESELVFTGLEGTYQERDPYHIYFDDVAGHLESDACEAVADAIEDARPGCWWPFNDYACEAGQEHVDQWLEDWEWACTF